MLKTKCLNPMLINALAKCGHGDRILIADGNYPLDSQANEGAERIYLNLTHGIPLVTDVLKVIEAVLPIESYTVMVDDTGNTSPIAEEFKAILPRDACCTKLGRFEFYEECRKEGLRAAILTGEQRLYSCIILTTGTVKKG
mgnify:CR=1 FL=1